MERELSLYRDYRPYVVKKTLYTVKNCRITKGP